MLILKILGLAGAVIVGVVLFFILIWCLGELIWGFMNWEE